MAIPAPPTVGTGSATIGVAVGVIVGGAGVLVGVGGAGVSVGVGGTGVFVGVGVSVGVGVPWASTGIAVRTKTTTSRLPAQARENRILFKPSLHSVGFGIRSLTETGSGLPPLASANPEPFRWRLVGSPILLDSDRYHLNRFVSPLYLR